METERTASAEIPATVALVTLDHACKELAHIAQSLADLRQQLHRVIESQRDHGTQPSAKDAVDPLPPDGENEEADAQARRKPVLDWHSV